MIGKRPPRRPITFAEVDAILDYNPQTGVLTWKWRENAWKGWNATWAGKPAGSSGSGGEGYSYVTINLRPVKAHRVAWLLHYGELPTGQIDHINEDKMDNRIANLRLATNAQNMRNRGANRNNRSGYKGVSFETWTQRWKAQIVFRGANLNLGRFDTPEEAHAAYQAAAAKWHGEFAKT